MYRYSRRSHPIRRSVGKLTTLALTLGLATAAVAAPIYNLTPLVTDDQDSLADLGFQPAVTEDPNLINPWGISFAPGGPFWVSNQVTNTSTLYDGDGAPFPPPPDGPLVVNIPHAGPPAGPTGQVFGGGAGLHLPSGNEGLFFFANLDGSISGWNFDSGINAELVVPPGDANRPAVYTGLAVASMGGGNFLYAANRVTGAIDVFDSNFDAATLLPGAFAAGANANGLVPFNVQNVGGLIYVTYSIPGDEADEAPLASGFVNVFNADGTFVRRIDSEQFSSPWGVVLAPDGFGEFSGALLVGNFSDEFGYINAFDATTGEFIGSMLNSDNELLIIPYLWGIVFGSGGMLSDADDLNFAAGIGDEEHGLFGEINPAAVPEPGTLGLLLVGMVALVTMRRRAS